MLTPEQEAEKKEAEDVSAVISAANNVVLVSGHPFTEEHFNTWIKEKFPNVSDAVIARAKAALEASYSIYTTFKPGEREEEALEKSNELLNILANIVERLTNDRSKITERSEALLASAWESKEGYETIPYEMIYLDLGIPAQTKIQSIEAVKNTAAVRSNLMAAAVPLKKLLTDAKNYYKNVYQIVTKRPPEKSLYGTPTKISDPADVIRNAIGFVNNFPQIYEPTLTVMKKLIHKEIPKTEQQYDYIADLLKHRKVRKLQTSLNLFGTVGIPEDPEEVKEYAAEADPSAEILEAFEGMPPTDLTQEQRDRIEEELEQYGKERSKELQEENPDASLEDIAEEVEKLKNRKRKYFEQRELAKIPVPEQIKPEVIPEVRPEKEQQKVIITDRIQKFIKSKILDKLVGELPEALSEKEKQQLYRITNKVGKEYAENIAYEDLEGLLTDIAATKSEDMRALGEIFKEIVLILRAKDELLSKYPWITHDLVDQVSRADVSKVPEYKPYLNWMSNAKLAAKGYNYLVRKKEQLEKSVQTILPYKDTAKYKDPFISLQDQLNEITAKVDAVTPQFTKLNEDYAVVKERADSIEYEFITSAMNQLNAVQNVYNAAIDRIHDHFLPMKDLPTSQSIKEKQQEFFPRQEKELDNVSKELYGIPYAELLSGGDEYKIEDVQNVVLKRMRHKSSLNVKANIPELNDYIQAAKNEGIDVVNASLIDNVLSQYAGFKQDITTTKALINEALAMFDEARFEIVNRKELEDSIKGLEKVQ